MRNHFDHLAKQLGQAALRPSGITVVNDPINPETQYADLRYEPDPARQAARDQLGLLGRIAGGVCLLEVYSQAPQETSPASDFFRLFFLPVFILVPLMTMKSLAEERRLGTLETLGSLGTLT